LRYHASSAAAPQARDCELLRAVQKEVAGSLLLLPPPLQLPPPLLLLKLK